MELSIFPLSDHESQCGYFPDRKFISEHFYSSEYSEEHLEVLLARGYRHFGTYFFRPVCGICTRCIPLRVPVGRYHFSKSARRILNKNRDLQTDMTIPSLQEEAFSLYMEHKRRFGETGNESREIFAESFFSHTSGAKQLSMYLMDKLVGISHFDETEHCLSAVYTYYSGGFPERSLGAFAVLQLLRLGMEKNKDYVYLGYYIEENRHMQYKARYYPNEISTTDDIWIPFMNERNECVNPKALYRGFSPFQRLF